jgi:acyl-CoA thioesterase-1
MRHWAALAIALVLSAAASAAASAETINIVAFGDSGVFGSGQGRTPGGVPVAEAYPPKLERALRERGWDVSVSNQGVRGGTARYAVDTIDLRIPPLTKLTIIQFGSNVGICSLRLTAISRTALRRSFAGFVAKVAR